VTALLVPAGEGESEYIEKKSRFLGHVWRAESEEEARGYLERVRKEHYDARHHCWCWRLPDGAERASDDGEPQGTAGQPMLSVFARKNVKSVFCVVTRYFGGTLLGPGGLVRAYTKAAQDALNDAGIAELREWAIYTIPCPYALLERVKLEVQNIGGTLDGAEYGEAVTIRTAILTDAEAAFLERLRELSAGSLRAERGGTVLRPAPAQNPGNLQ
jgi:uncharacterized YigZ family protein